MINQKNLFARDRKMNDAHIKKYEKFMKKNKLDNALVLTESGEVVDLYSEAIQNIKIGHIASIWKKFFYQLSDGVFFVARVFIKASNFGSIWTRVCYMLSGGFNYFGSILIRLGNYGS